MQKQKIFLIAGIVLGLISVVMVKLYLDQQRDLMKQQAKRALAEIQANQVAVLIAKVDIPKGTAVKPEMLDTAIIPKQYIQPQAVTSLDRIADMVTIAPISKDEQITLNKLAQSKEAVSFGGLSQATPVGKRAITISVDNFAALSGMVQAGDYVDVIAVLPIPMQNAEGKQEAQTAVVPLFQNVLILAVGQELGGAGGAASGRERYRKEEKKTPSEPITLALTPQEANLIAFVQEQGKLRLILRSPADSQLESVQPASWDTLFQYLYPERFKPQAPEQPSGDVVEIYRGTKRDQIYLQGK